MQNTNQKTPRVNCGNFRDDMQTIEEELDPAETIQLYQMAESIDWLALEKEIIPILGSSAEPVVRLVCGVTYLKSFYDLSSAEVIEKWPICSDYRYFCGNAINEEPTTAFPISLYVLDMLTNKLNGKGYDAMIRVLLATSNDRDMQLDSRVIH